MIPRKKKQHDGGVSGSDKKRTSTRVRTLSKAMRQVDEETRKEHRDLRLRALEADNYAEELVADNSDEENFDEEDETIARKKKKQKASSLLKSKWSSKKVKSLDRMIVEQGYSTQMDPKIDGANYLSVTALPSMYPARQFCSVCGCLGKYKCVRCGLRFCSRKCNTQHQETRCMNFSL